MFETELKVFDTAVREWRECDPMDDPEEECLRKRLHLVVAEMDLEEAWSDYWIAEHRGEFDTDDGIPVFRISADSYENDLQNYVVEAVDGFSVFKFDGSAFLGDNRWAFRNFEFFPPLSNQHHCFNYERRPHPHHEGLIESLEEEIQRNGGWEVVNRNDEFKEARAWVRDQRKRVLLKMELSIQYTPEDEYEFDA